MAYAAPPPPRLTPRVTFSSLAEVLSAPFPKAQQILKAQKYPKAGPTFSYKRAAEIAADHLVNGTVVNPTAHRLRPHEMDALAAFVAAGSVLPPNTSASPPPKLRPKWFMQNVEISAYPEITITGQIGANGTGSGALKFYMRKEPLGGNTGPAMAALLYYYQSQVLGLQNAHPAYCVVYDVRVGVPYVATGSYTRLINQVQAACSMIHVIWPTL
ncbi:hypothetical protein [Sorangium sp. So ce861]|uniref:hypothetical protein n=1 Tax=Sorangium sp. So ce861 TaxID=3133323 RepID=UPI003F5FC774